jgi:hypothetical protein
MVPATANGWSVGEATADILPDDILLTIFSLYKEVYSSDLSWWDPLVHVCRRWRQVIFASPLRLNLTLLCTSGTPTSESLDIWPPFPIAIHSTYLDGLGDLINTNVKAALGHRDRVTEIRFDFLRGCNFSSLSRLLSPFPALTYLSLESELIVHSGFVLSLGGSAPSLRTLLLKRIPILDLPKLLRSATQLVTLQLYSVPAYPYIPPVMLATCFAVMPNLRQFGIEIYASYLSDQPPLPTRVVLPSLTSFHFMGSSEYLEELLAQIDAPILQTFSVTFLDLDVHTPQLLRFVNCAERLGPPIRVMAKFDFDTILHLKFMPTGFELAILCENSARQISSMAWSCRELLPLLARVERLDLYCDHILLFTESVDPWHWVELFQPFMNLQNLYVSRKMWPQLAPMMQDLTGERAAEVLPQLRTLFLEELEQFEQVWESIGPFIAARRHSDQPVAVKQCIALDFAEC